ncbi:GNAT family N-acetyltransferase [Leptolyngbya sp. NIES-2104]|uniref:GNAT family N-acetyltransferase n=1 Tax=Leptolyngbya sp. NIES-2104 TaxID=1552121 RepID=UPI0006ECB79D|nr:GNAT family N-acetyltransferase [Leptolyngbya sp. NIES-2104]GAP97399.1 acetyltransferase, GNAT family [Leptolyngbya sp. NIES-2104]
MESKDIVAAIVSNLESYWLNYGRTSHGELFEHFDCSGFSTIVPTPLYNGVIRTQFGLGTIDERIDQTIDHFAQKQLPFVWWTTSLAEPSILETSLEAHGLTRIMELPGMAIDLSTFSPVSERETIEILKVEDAATLEQWVKVAMIGFETPMNLFDSLFVLESELEMPYSRYLALWNGQPAGISALYPKDGIAGIYFVATIPEARRQGIALAVTQAALKEAQNLGYQLAILQASPMGTPLYARLGFQEYCKLSLFLWTPDH